MGTDLALWLLIGSLIGVGMYSTWLNKQLTNEKRYTKYLDSKLQLLSYARKN